MQVVALYSNKGGVGKTAAAVNLAHAWASAGHRTLLCDLDAQGASSFYFRVKPSKRLENETFFKDVRRFTKAIRGSDYDSLDILPSNLSFRDFDVFLSRMKNPNSRLKKALRGVRADYDVILLDCPPNISALSENVFRSAQRIVVPVIPTTLSERTLEQLIGFFEAERLNKKKLVPFFSMVQRRKAMHLDTMDRLRKAYGKRFLKTPVPFSTDVERMGLHRAPVATYAPRSAAAGAYAAIWDEVRSRL